jgi:hypothetical protein
MANDQSCMNVIIVVPAHTAIAKSMNVDSITDALRNNTTLPSESYKFYTRWQFSVTKNPLESFQRKSTDFYTVGCKKTLAGSSMAYPRKW